MKKLLIASFTLGICISFAGVILSKNEYKCNNLKLSEKNYIEVCRLNLNRPKDSYSFANSTKFYNKSIAFCKCIHTNFTVRAWANETCDYEPGVRYHIMNMANNNVNVEEYCGHLRP